MKRNQQLKIMIGILTTVLVIFFLAFYTYLEKILKISPKNRIFLNLFLNIKYLSIFKINYFSIFVWLCTITTVSLICLVIFHVLTKKKYKKRNYEEHGSARWGNEKEKKLFASPIPKDNVILSQNILLGLNEKNINFKYQRNKNILVIGGSGSGKTRFFVKPNLMQMNTSYIITDPKGTILDDVGNMLEKKGKYKIKVLNLIDMNQSMRYNPFQYISNQQELLTFVTTFMANTSNINKTGGDEFWEKAERMLYLCLISLMFIERREKDRNFKQLLEYLSLLIIPDKDEDSKLSLIDLKFNKIKEALQYNSEKLFLPEKLDYSFYREYIMTEELKGWCSFALTQYELFKNNATSKTGKTILLFASIRLSVFNVDKLVDLTLHDELELDKIGDEKTALFIITSDTNSTYNFILSLIYTQLFNLLCEKADNIYRGKLPFHVRLIMDEFANIGLIPSFERLIATIRSRNISANIILQNETQLNDIYKEKAGIIMGNCDSTIFLGGTEKTTLKNISEMLGKQTIETSSSSRSYSTQRSYSSSLQKSGRELMTIDELFTMENENCIVTIRGCRPFFDKKFDLTTHQRYKYLAEVTKNKFIVQDYLEKYRNKLENEHTLEQIIDIDNRYKEKYKVIDKI